MSRPDLRRERFPRYRSCSAAALLLCSAFLLLLAPAARSLLPGFHLGCPVSAAQQNRQRPPAVTSPEVHSDRQVTFRIHTPQATEVILTAGDIPGTGRGIPMARGEGEVWEVTLGPLEAGAYRYRFTVDGVAVVDPRNPLTSESNNAIWSLVCVPGSGVMDLRDVPHGAVAEVPYYSRSLGAFRRLHVYTPPGYERSRESYPVFYLLHGAGDCDDAWSTVGRAGIILDNLIAAGRAEPMVVVMPSGHIRPWESAPGENPPAGAIEEDFLSDIMPFVEERYRVDRNQARRAIAGLSMGGSQTLNIAFSDLERFGYVGVFSSGLIGSFGRRRGGGGADTPGWEERHAGILDDARLRRGLKLLWFATGKDDFLLETSRGTVELLRAHGFEVVYEESGGGHTWLNWRDYLQQFVPQLFR